MTRRFNGHNYIQTRDAGRLSDQFDRIFTAMRDGIWRTLEGIELLTSDPQASISAQLRHARKARFGSHTVNKRHMGGGLYEYQLVVNQAKVAA